MDEAALQEFKKLYFQKYNIELSDREVFEYASRLIAFVKTVYGNNMPKLKIDKN